jgi:SAM-dependent methyltransferase
MSKFTSLPDIQRRRRQDEVMDDPELAEPLHLQAFNALERINLLTFSWRLFWPTIQAIAREKGKEPVRILDVGTGAGDVPVRIAKFARRRGVAVQMAGCDKSPRSLAQATKRAKSTGIVMDLFPHCILDGQIPERYDLVMCSLFLHHFSEADAACALQHMAAAADHSILVHDLKRNRAGHLLALAAAYTLTLSPVVHVDAPRSVESAFTVEEVRATAHGAGLDPVTITHHWPCRFLLKWSRPR